MKTKRQRIGGPFQKFETQKFSNCKIMLWFRCSYVGVFELFMKLIIWKGVMI